MAITGSTTYTTDDLLKITVERRASDLHLTVGLPPMLRVDGQLKSTEFPKLTPPDTQRLVYSILNDFQKSKFESTWDLDFSYSLHGFGRFRVNIFKQRGAVAAALRSIPNDVPSREKLSLPLIIEDVVKRPTGLILVTGPTGVGKSTTLACMLDIVNKTRSAHIVTIEDPIEYIHSHKKSMINQREVGQDTKSWEISLRAVLREDPDVILVGEMRDLETISLTLTAAETGHLVFSTLHTANASQTIDRIIDVFPPHQQQQIKVQLSSVLEAVFSQKLIPHASGVGRVPATEVLLANSAIRNLIREGKTHQIYTVLQTSSKSNMQTMEQCLVDLLIKKQIVLEEALRHTMRLDDFLNSVRESLPGIESEYPDIFFNKA